MKVSLPLVLSFVLLAACGGGGSEPATPTASTPAVGEKTVPSVVERSAKVNPIEGGAFPGTRFDDLPASGEDALVLLYSNNVDGEIEPCG